MHVALKPSRSMKRRTTSPQIATTASTTTPSTPTSPTDTHIEPSDSTATLTSHTPTSVRSPIFRIADSDTGGGLSSLTLQEEDDTGEISSESECIVSEPTGFKSPDLSSPDRKVQFVIGGHIDDIPEDEVHTSDPSTQIPVVKYKEKKNKRG